VGFVFPRGEGSDTTGGAAQARRTLLWTTLRRNVSHAVDGMVGKGSPAVWVMQPTLPPLNCQCHIELLAVGFGGGFLLRVSVSSSTATPWAWLSELTRALGGHRRR
jgi:hypothetical protein